VKGFIPSLFEKRDFFNLGGAIVTSPRHKSTLIPTDSGATAQWSNMFILHLYANSIIHQTIPNLPPWLEEGFASFYGLTEFKGDKVLSVWSYSQAGSFQAPNWAMVDYLWMDSDAWKAWLFEAHMKALPAPERKAGPKPEFILETR